MLWRVEIKPREGVFDAAGEGIHKDIHDLGIHSLTQVRISRHYTLDGNSTEDQIKEIAQRLLVDPITQEYVYCKGDCPPSLESASTDIHSIEIAYNPGVMDPVEESTLKGIRDLGIKTIKSVRTSQRYFLSGALSLEDQDLIVSKVLSNKLIQHVVRGPEQMPASKKKECPLIFVDILKATSKDLMKISQKGQLFLNLNEMKAMQKHFKKLKRNPTDCELETIAQTWSEHCYHKTFKSTIRYSYTEKGKKKNKLIRNLFKSTIVKATQEIKKPWCVSVFHDNAGVIRFNEEFHVCFKVETHNHPSALEPFGGANTGVGGVIRDILGTGLGAKPICSTDIFCFAPHDMRLDELPPGVFHPKRIMKGVVSGVRDYGNKMGIPTVNGAVLFDRGFAGNPLVFCGNVGLIPRDKVKKQAKKHDLIVVVGGRTGRDGIHGATFSSGELTSESEVVSSGAVQIGNPIQEKKVLDALIKARDENLYTAITDCGAGGLSSAVGEMGKDLGVRVDLQKVPLKYEGLSYTEIWISESQERMVLAVPAKNEKRLLEIFSLENVEAAMIGEFTGTKRLELFYKEIRVCDLDMGFLYEGIPQVIKEAKWIPLQIKENKLPENINLKEKLCQILSDYNVCSKEWVIRQYDHEVQGQTVIKPFVGVSCDGPSDAAVITPQLGSNKGIVIANGINVRFGMIDPFWMAASCIDEAIRQIIAVGGDLKRIAILDNFCWGNPDKPDRLGSLVRCAQGCYKTAVGYGVPFISGKDSLYNEYTVQGESMAIPGTVLISAIGIMEDVTQAVTMDLKGDGNLLYCVGLTKEELGGSIYFNTFGLLGQDVPQVDTKLGVKIFTALSKAVQEGLIQSMHDCSEGGLAVALAEMAFSGGLGVEVNLNQVPSQGRTKRDDYILFSESNSRFVVEIEPKNKTKFEFYFNGVPFNQIGQVKKSINFIIYGLDKKVCIHADIQNLKDAWQRPLRW